MKMLFFSLMCILLEINTNFVFGFSAGPPFSSCLTFFPKHNNKDGQTTKPPFIISIQSENYSPGQDINITVRSTKDHTLIGIQIAIHRSTGDEEELLGEFTSFPEEKVMAMNCIDGKRNMIGHKNNKAVKEVSVIWKAPTNNEGNLTMFTSIVETFEVFWVNLKNQLPSKTNIPYTPKPVPSINLQKTISIDYDSCGESRGCILYPVYCSGDNCDVAVTFKDEGNRTRFQMSSKMNEGYISIGFSDDKLMGMDHTITCTINEGEYTVQNGYNPFYYNYRQYKRDELQDMVVALQDGKLMCEFTRPKSMSLVNMVKPSERITFDINNDYYVMVAWGPMKRGTPAVTHHVELPVTTNSKVDFKSTKIYRGAALPSLTQVHALLMVIAWILFTGTATIIARYFKSSFGDKMILGAKTWFQTHRAFAILAASLTAVSFVIIFVQVDGFTEVAELHAYFGIALMATTTLQIIGGILRPDPDSKIRPVFNWGHWFLGKISHVVAAISIILAYNIKLIPKTQSMFGTVIAIIWIVCQILWEIFYEIRQRRGGSADFKTPASLRKADMVLLCVYIINMLLILFISCMAIYFF